MPKAEKALLWFVVPCLEMIDAYSSKPSQDITYAPLQQPLPLLMQQ
jgi:hypothetical protein